VLWLGRGDKAVWEQHRPRVAVGGVSCNVDGRVDGGSGRVHRDAAVLPFLFDSW
jgi:hypothetical protein